MKGRGNLKPIDIYLFLLLNNYLVNLLGIPVGTLCGLDSDGWCLLRFAPLTNWARIYQANVHAVDCCPCARRYPHRVRPPSVFARQVDVLIKLIASKRTKPMVGRGLLSTHAV